MIWEAGGEIHQLPPSIETPEVITVILFQVWSNVFKIWKCNDIPMISEIISFLGTHISLDGLPKKIGFKEEFSTVEQFLLILIGDN